ncbi:hypothetical protein TNCV_1892411 [Trichonephila clavipes]|nr:hypothetical protein TNCV_1892411 [Trichonephila clavipes]
MPRTQQSDPLLTQTASEKFNLIDLIPMYDRGESLGIRRFLEKINDVANLGKWSNAKKVTILKLKLAGIAEEFFYPTQSTVILQNSTMSQEFSFRDLRGPFRCPRRFSYFHHAFKVHLKACKNSQHASTN